MSINLGEGNKINSQFIIANSGNTYGTNYSYLGVGGFYELSSKTERNDIPVDSLKIMNGDGYSSGRRRLQMIVHTLDDGKYWQLLPQLKIGYRAGPLTFIAYSSDTRVSDSLWVTLSNAEKLVLLDPTITVFDSTTNRFYFGSGDANTAWYDTPLQVYITGGTFNSGTSVLQLFDTSGNTISVTGITTWPGIDIHVTGFTYSANTLTISNSSGSPFSVTINTMTGLTIDGNLTVTGNTNISGNTILNNLSANTISGGTFIGNGSGLTNVQNIYNTDGFLTGNRIVDLSGKTLSFRRTSGFNQTFLNLIDDSNNVLTEFRASLTVPIDIEYPNLFIGKNAGVNATTLVRTNLAVGNSSLTAMTSGIKNTVFGNFSFQKLIRGSFNTVIGDTVAINYTGATTGNLGDDNVFIGNASALSQLEGRRNVYVGTNTKEFSISGNNNVIVGHAAGRSNLGSDNVFLGYRAGQNEVGGSNLLYIENTSSSTPLIYGDFANDLLRFNGKVGVNVLPGTYQFDVNGTSRFSNTVQIDTVNLGSGDTKILTLSSGNVVQYRNFSDFTGGTAISGDYLPLSGGTVTGNTIFQSGLTANTISATTYLNLPVNTDVYVTGFTYNDSNTFFIFDNSGTTFDASINIVTGLTVNGVLTLPPTTGNTYGLINVGNNSFIHNYGTGNTYVGEFAGSFSGANIDNVAVGNYSLSNIINGDDNTAIGSVSLLNLISGSSNTALGVGSLESLVNGNTNTSVGGGALVLSTSGSSNTSLGFETLFNNLTGSSNVAIGYRAGYNETGSNRLHISNTDTNTLIYGEFDNLRVGINTTSPTNMLHVAGSIDPVRFEGLQLSSDTNVVTTDNNGVLHYLNLSNITGATSADTYTTGFTYSANTFYIFDNSGATLTATINDVTGLTVNGNLNVTGDTILNNLSANTISATTISGGTFYGDGTNLLGIPKYYAEPSTPPANLPPAVNGLNSIAIGDRATSSSESFVVGSFAGPSLTTGHTGSTMIGYYAGNNADLAYNSVFIGYNSGYNAFSSFNSNFIGKDAGRDNYSGNNANFIGVSAGSGSEAGFANFIGYEAGRYALALYGNAIGYKAGSESDPLPGGGSIVFDSSYSNLIGFRAGQSFSGVSPNAIGNNNIIIGTNISLPHLVTNSINIGGVLFGINTHSTTIGDPSVVPTTNGKIGIGIVTPLNRLHVEDLTDPLRLVGLQSGNTDTRILTSDSNGVIKYRNLSDFNTGSTSVVGDYLPLSGGTVTGDTIFQSGLTATTISATTYLNLPIDPDVYVTGFTYSANTLTISDNSGSTFTATINNFTGLTINGNLNVTGDTTLNNLTANTISATTISGGTLYGDGSNLTGIINIYTSNGTLTGNRTLSLSGSYLDISSTAGTTSRFFSNGRFAVGTTSDLGNQFVVSSIADPVRFVNMSTVSADTFLITADSNGVLRELGGAVANRIPHFNSSSAITTTPSFEFRTPTATATLVIPGNGEGATGSQIRLNNGRVLLSSGGIGGLDIYVGNGQTGGVIDQSKAINFQNNGRNFLTLLGEGVATTATTASTRAAFTSRVSIDTGITPLGRDYWGTTGVAFSVAGRPWVDITSNGSRTDLAYTSIGIPTFTASSGTNYNGIYTFYIDGSPTLGTNVSGTTYAMYVRTGNILFGGLSFTSADTRILTSNSNGLVSYTNLSSITAATSADTYVTAFTYSSNTFTISDNSGSTFNATINSVTGLTINGNLNVTGNTTLNSLTANTISATTYVNLPFNYYITGSTPTGVVLNYGDRWYNTNNGIELVWITDGNSDQWVQPAYNTIPQAYNNVLVTSGITTSSATLSMNVNYYGVNYNGDVDLTLPSPVGYDGYNMNIKDEGGYAGTTRIRITPASGTIDGNPYVDMNINYMSLHVVARNNNWWII